MVGLIADILSLVEKHEEWRGRRCINLIPSENVMSSDVRRLLSSEMAHRYTAPDRFYMGTRFVDNVEKLGEDIAKRIFKAETADLRPLSGHIADWIFLANFTSRGDLLMCVSAEDGGYPGLWNRGLPKYLGLELAAFPFSKEKMKIRIEEAKMAIIKAKPRVIIFGASLFLFPHPVRELAEVAKEVGAHVGFDGSHVMGLIAGGGFQSPLQEGASTLFGSTHKTFFGPQGGIILANKEYGETLKKKVHPAFVDNAHWNRIAALTLALAEMEEFGKMYAKQVIQNAQTLAKTLYDFGFPVVGSGLGYTMSHQVLLNYGGYKQGREIAELLERANIIVDCGVRLGTCEATRRGMREAEIEQVAVLIKQVVMDRKPPGKIKKDVEKLAREFHRIEYSFTH
jgi:glycine hydroxymethyltransferase